MKTLFFLITASALAFCAAAEGRPVLSLSVKPEREVIPTAGGREILVQIEVQAGGAGKKRTTPINLAVVLDRSGSMAGAKLEKARQAAAVALDHLGPDDYNEDLMTALAEASHANYYYVRNVEKLPGIFAEELGTVKSVVARNVKVTVTLPEGVKPKGVLGEDEITFNGQSVTIPLSDFHGSQTRRFLVSCETPEGDSEELDLAQVSIAYEDVESGRSLGENQTARVKRSADAKVVEASLRADVAANSAITQNRLAKEHAVKLADAGKSKDAADLLLRQATANAALPAAAQSPLLQKENEILRDKAEELKTSGSLSKASRKEVQYQNYQDKNQKR